MLKRLAYTALAVTPVALGGCGAAQKLGEAPPAVVDGAIAVLRWLGGLLLEVFVSWWLTL